MWLNLRNLIHTFRCTAIFLTNTFSWTFSHEIHALAIIMLMMLLGLIIICAIYYLPMYLPVVVISISLICTVSSDDRGLLSSICSPISFTFSYTLYAGFLKFNLNANDKTTHLVHIIFTKI